MNSDGCWLVGNTELASEQERTASSTLDIGSGGSEVTRMFVVLAELSGNSPSKLLRTLFIRGFLTWDICPSPEENARRNCLEPSQSTAQPVPLIKH